MRIISGFLKARRFSVPKSFPSRPTTDFAKEGLFNILEHQIDFQELKVLDLCAGTGNISFEFISRGAKSIIAVDSHTNCLKFILSNAKKLEVNQNIQTQKADILQFLQRCDQKFDLIFADPPYAYPDHAQIVNLVFEKNLLNPDGILIVEHGRNTDLSKEKHFDFVRSYGNVYFSFFRFDK